jgi:phosphoglycolate phosphatase
MEIMVAIVFDLDGTLVQSAPDIHNAVNHMLAQNGHDKLSLAVVTSFIGNGVPKLIERAMIASDITITDATHAQLMKQFSDFYAENPVGKSYLFDGVVPALEKLFSAGHKMAVCTNKPFDMTAKVLDGLNISPFFGAVIGGDSLPVNKPDPAMLFKVLDILDVKDCFYIGDSEVDASTAENARQPFFFYTEGYSKISFDEMVAEAKFSHFDELCGLIEKRIAV